jgi:hypothetical protein
MESRSVINHQPTPGSSQLQTDGAIVFYGVLMIAAVIALFRSLATGKLTAVGRSRKRREYRQQAFDQLKPYTSQWWKYWCAHALCVVGLIVFFYIIFLRH